MRTWTLPGLSVAFFGLILPALCEEKPAPEAAREIQRIQTGSLATGLAISPDGKTLALSGPGLLILLHEIPSGDRLGSMDDDHAGEMFVTYDLEFSPDGKTLFSIGSEGARNWNATEAELAAPFFRNQGGFSMKVVGDKPIPDTGNDLAVSPDGKLLATIDAEGRVNLRDLTAPPKPGKEWPALRSLPAETGKASFLAFTPDANKGLLVQGGGGITLWDPATGKLLAKVETPGGPLAVSPDGKRLAVGEGSGKIRLYDLKTLKETQTFEGHTQQARALAFSRDGKLLASGSMDGTVRLWEAGSGKPNGTLKAHEGGVLETAFSPDGKLLATSGLDGTVALWELGE